MNSQPTILAGRVKDLLWIRVEGKGSFQNSGQLKEFAHTMIDKGNSAMVVDLEDCPVMDSTFMGTLSGIGLKLMQAGRLHIINANERNRKLLVNLGLDHILAIEGSESKWSDESRAVSPSLTGNAGEQLDKEETRKLMLEAHRTLGEVNPENLPRFKDVIEYLQEESQQEEGR